MPLALHQRPRYTPPQRTANSVPLLTTERIDTLSHKVQALQQPNNNICVPRNTISEASDSVTHKRSRRNFAHPLGLPTTINSDPFLHLSVTDIFSRITANTVALQFASIAKSSQSTYSTGWSHWISYTRAIKSDPFLHTIPIEFSSQELIFTTFIETMIIGFMLYLHYDRKCIPSTIQQYLSHVRFAMSLAGLNVTVTKSIVIQKVFSGMLLEWRLKPGNSIAERQHLAFTPDMITATIKTLDLRKNKDFALAVAVKTGFQHLTRVGELVETSSPQQHHLLGKSVSFECVMTDGIVIQVPSCDAHKYSITNVQRAFVDIVDSKNDPEGKGFRYTSSKRGPADLTHADSFCICSDLFECASRTRPTPHESFFKSSIEKWQIKDTDLTKFIKAGARLFNLNTTRFVIHSLRIAGASALSAINAPAWYIKLAGRWTTDQYLTYIRITAKSYQEFMIAMQTSMTATDFHQSNPSLTTQPYQRLEITE
jgi:hypothetical protein